MGRTFVSGRTTRLIAALLAGGLVASAGLAQRRRRAVYASVEEAKKAGPDFDIQGEYEGTIGGDAKKKIGVQVIALGRGGFQAVFLPGGLPGAGWDGKVRILAAGKVADDVAIFVPAKGKRRYLAGPPEQFSAAKEFPPPGQKDYTATVGGGKLVGKTDAGEAIVAAKVLRKSPTLGAKPPKGAIVLLPYEPGRPTSLAEWANQKWLTLPAGHAQVSGGGNNTKRRFGGAWTLHVEFMTPFRPDARGQGRGNSGVYAPGGREVQVLDSFGLAGLANECGGIYKSHPPRVNMCLPPLSWQTYDITYRPPTPGGAGKGKGERAWYKVVHNGVTIHEKVPLGGARTAGLNLQDHGNPVCYRNIWIFQGELPAGEPAAAPAKGR